MPTRPTRRFDEPALWEAVRLGEDSRLELKEVTIKGKRLAAPRRSDLADELAAFANANGGRLVLGVTDRRTPQALSPTELDVLMAVVRHGAADPLRLERAGAAYGCARRTRHALVSGDAGRLLRVRLSV